MISVKKKKILLIGGGTGGHILPLKNLSDELLKLGAEVELIVSEQPLDRKIVEENFDTKSISVHYFKTGKIRRYLSLQNFIDFFRIIGSIFAAQKLLKETGPDILFFKGGFVGFPILVAAKYLMRFQGKIYSHESDTVSGITTRFASKYADEVFHSFGDDPMPLFYSPPHVRAHNPSPRLAGELPLIKGAESRKRILILGGSQGAEFLNKLVEKNAKSLCEKYNVTLICGIGKEINFKHKNFRQSPFLSADEYAQKIQETDFVVSRAGSSSLFEIICAKKPSLIIPLPSAAQNHQMKNAEFFQKQNLCHVLKQDKESSENFLKMIEAAMQDKKMEKALQACKIHNSAKKIAKRILR